MFGKGILFYPIFQASDSFAEDEGPSFMKDWNEASCLCLWQLSEAF